MHHRSRAVRSTKHGSRTLLQERHPRIMRTTPTDNTQTGPCGGPLPASASTEALNRIIDAQNLALQAANEALEREKEQRRRGERALAEYKDRYRRLTDGLSDCIYTVHLEDGYAMAVSRNAPCTRVTGHPPEEHSQDPELWMRIVLREDRHLLIDNIKHILATGQTSTVEYRLRHRDGRILWVSDTLIPQYDTGGELIGYDGVIKDITIRKEAEQQLLRSKATLAMAIDGMSDPLLLFDRDFLLVRMNRGALQYFGLDDAQAAIGKPCFAAFAGRTDPCKGCATPFSSQRGFSGIYERRGAMDPERLEQIVIDTVQDATGTPEAYIVRIFDITEERAQERQLIQGEKLASLGLLSAGIAHEINNPNNFIFFNIPILRSYLQFLIPIADAYMTRHPEMRVFNRSYEEFRADCFKLLDNIEHGSTRINQIVGNLREFVRERGQGERRLTNLRHVAEKAISICQGRLRKGIKTFETDLPEDLPPLVTDPLAVEQVMVNLLINAIQAADKPASWIRLAIAARDNDELHLTISDNGSGMDPHTQEKIFDPFFTTKAAGVGTGLGLSICHRLVTELGARIEVASELGKGSRFTVIFMAESR